MSAGHPTRQPAAPCKPCAEPPPWHAKASAFVTAIRPYIETVKAARAHSLPEIAKALDALGIKIARGGKCHLASVWFVLTREAEAA
ncbi:hypothetical protein MAE02_49690 [Microvirga aerophila]|uniref:Uncharacterized protein n=1 Tax=Microvirga aerophila TaxID=670291 RepID=A0A512BZ90_9HYPH|nr:hypothetical protein MAE02_49690 [Microvirga aerophila]